MRALMHLFLYVLILSISMVQSQPTRPPNPYPLIVYNDLIAYEHFPEGVQTQQFIISPSRLEFMGIPIVAASPVPSTPAPAGTPTPTSTPTPTAATGTGTGTGTAIATVTTSTSTSTRPTSLTPTPLSASVPFTYYKLTPTAIPLSTPLSTSGPFTYYTPTPSPIEIPFVTYTPTPTMTTTPTSTLASPPAPTPTPTPTITPTTAPALSYDPRRPSVSVRNAVVPEGARVDARVMYPIYPAPNPEKKSSTATATATASTPIAAILHDPNSMSSTVFTSAKVRSNPFLFPASYPQPNLYYEQLLALQYPLTIFDPPFNREFATLLPPEIAPATSSFAVPPASIPATVRSLGEVADARLASAGLAPPTSAPTSATTTPPPGTGTGTGGAVSTPAITPPISTITPPTVAPAAVAPVSPVTAANIGGIYAMPTEARRVAMLPASAAPSYAALFDGMSYGTLLSLNEATHSLPSTSSSSRPSTKISTISSTAALRRRLSRDPRQRQQQQQQQQASPILLERTTSPDANANAAIYQKQATTATTPLVVTAAVSAVDVPITIPTTPMDSLIGYQTDVPGVLTSINPVPDLDYNSISYGFSPASRRIVPSPTISTYAQDPEARTQIMFPSVNQQIMERLIYGYDESYICSHPWLSSFYRRPPWCRPPPYTTVYN